MNPGATGPWPTVSVVVPTRDRPELVRRAVQAVLGQDYPGSIECIVVFDQCDPDDIVVPAEDGERRRLVPIRNARKPGLAGGRNSGILASTGDVVAFCDDDDEWLDGKLMHQMQLWEAHPAAPVIATGIQIRTADGDHDRPAPAVASFDDFLASRITEIHPSSLLIRRADLLGSIGLVDEDIPNSFGEDYEFLLRATRQGDVRSVPEPLVRINWNRPSFFVGRWESIADALSYLLAKVPEFDRDPQGRARIQGQIAFALAALGRRRESHHWAWKALRHRPTEPRALASYAVANHLVRADRLVRMVQRTGRGL